jgi:hypothetical protein
VIWQQRCVRRLRELGDIPHAWRVSAVLEHLQDRRRVQVARRRVRHDPPRLHQKQNPSAAVRAVLVFDVRARESLSDGACDGGSWARWRSIAHAHDHRQHDKKKDRDGSDTRCHRLPEAACAERRVPYIVLERPHRKPQTQRKGSRASEGQRAPARVSSSTTGDRHATTLGAVTPSGRPRVMSAER